LELVYLAENALKPEYCEFFKPGFTEIAGISEIFWIRFLKFALKAVVLHYMDNPFLPMRLRSEYNMAHILGAPVSYLFHDQRNCVLQYEKVITTHGYDIYGYRLSKSLHVQVKLLHQRYPKIFSALCAGIALLKTAKTQSDYADLYVWLEERWLYYLDNYFGFSLASVALSWHEVDQHSQYIAAMIMTQCLCCDREPKPALGYHGPDITDDYTKYLLDSGKLKAVDQGDMLTSHSSLRVPSDELLYNIYYKHIICADGYQFGRYC